VPSVRPSPGCLRAESKCGEADGGDKWGQRDSEAERWSLRFNFPGHAGHKDTITDRHPQARRSASRQRLSWQPRRSAGVGSSPCEVPPRLDIPPICSIILVFEFNWEDKVMMRIVTKNTQAARLRGSGGALLPWSQCACR
jgi:hypothetical protein